MFYYQLIPLTKIPLSRKPYFTYCSESQFPFGSLVEINFANKKLKGIIFKTTKKPKFKTKMINKLLRESLLTKNQLLFAEQISTLYFTSLGVVLKFFIPSITKKLAAPKSLEKSKSPAGPMLTTEQRKVISSILKSKQSKFLLFGPASSGKTEIIMKVVESMIKKDKQSLILIPEIFLSYQEIYRYQQRFGKENVALIHSHLKSSELFNLWQKISNNEIKIIIATRTGVFFPFNNLGFIAIDEEQDISHKQWDQSPRYHLHDLAPCLAKIFNAKVLLCSATPSLESIHKTETKELTKLELPFLKTKKFSVEKPHIQIIDLKKYYFKNKNKPLIISDELILALEKNIVKKNISLILVSNRGRSRAVICQDCKKILRCQNCDAPLIASEDRYHCLHCSFNISSFSKCPNCNSFHLKSVGFGTEKVADDLKNSYPSAKIKYIDQNVFQKEANRVNLYQELASGQIDILIGSQSIIKGFDIPKVDLVAVINADNWSGQSDYRFDERWLGNLFQLCGRLNRPGSSGHGTAIIQTFNPEEPLLKYLLNWNWESFANNELENRMALRFPPYNKLIKLTFKDFNQIKVDKTAKTVYNKILELESKEIITVFSPYYGFVKRIRNKWQKNVLIKAKEISDPKLIELLKEAASTCTIDISPENIF